MFPEGRILDILIVFAVALIVVGPKDLPILMRKVGRFVAHMRGLAAEFRASFDEMARQSELDELRKEVEAMKAQTSLSNLPGLSVDPHMRGVFDDIHQGLHEPLVPPVAAAESPEPPEPELPLPEPAHGQPVGDEAPSGDHPVQAVP